LGADNPQILSFQLISAAAITPFIWISEYIRNQLKEWWDEFNTRMDGDGKLYYRTIVKFAREKEKTRTEQDLIFVKLIAATRTQVGLKVKAKLDTNSYPGGIKVSKAELENVQLRPDKFHGDWNYTILPHASS
jgi:Rhodopirellula transposase DDE domain